MSVPLPKNFTSVTDAHNASVNSMHNMAGAVVDVMSPRNSASGEYMASFDLGDHGCRSGIKIRYFKKALSDIPVMPEIGDIVIVRNVKRTSFRNMSLMLSTYTTESIIFDQRTIPELSFRAAYEGGKNTLMHTACPPDAKPTIAEQIYVMSAMREMQGSTSRNNVTDAPSESANYDAPAEMRRETPKRVHHLAPTKFCLLQDAYKSRFCDLTVEVIKVFPSKYGNFVELYVTDYTSNHDFFQYLPPEQSRGDEGRDGDEYNYIQHGQMQRQWPGPYGHTVLRIDVFHPHMRFVLDKIDTGNFINMQNVRVKMSTSGTLEGNLMADNDRPEKILISITKPEWSEHSNALLERKEAYWKQRDVDVQEVERRNGRISGPKAQDSEKGNGAKRSKAQKRSQRKREEKLKLVQVVQDKVQREQNTNVSCSASHVAESSLLEISSLRGQTREGITLPFVNQKRKVKVRVIDYYPPDIRHFSRRPIRLDQGLAEDADVEMLDADTPWEWSFFLLLEDAMSRPVSSTWVHVPDDAARRLLATDPIDLNVNAQALTHLREQLFKMWGNLEEIKPAIDLTKGDLINQADSGEDRWDGKLSNKAFHCCLAEYGQELDVDDADASNDSAPWLRLFQMFDTQIL